MECMECKTMFVVYWNTDEMKLQEQINRLTDFLVQNFYAEIAKGEAAVDCAIRLLKARNG